MKRSTKNLKYFETVSGQELMPGVVAVIQTFGDHINFHPRIHVLVNERGEASDKHYHKVSRFHDDLMRELFTREVFSLLLRKRLINLQHMQKILSWRHTGFSVHSQVRAKDKRENL